MTRITTPHPAPTMLFPVYGHSEHFRREVVAEFFDWGSAASFAMRPQDFGAERRNLYVTSKQHPRASECDALTDKVERELRHEMRRRG